jgi:hypothetical protein
LARAKTVLRVGGTTIAMIGLLCIPVGLNVFQKSDLSVFHNIADLGVFVPMGVVFVTIGVVAIGLSSLIPGEMDQRLRPCSWPLSGSAERMIQMEGRVRPEGC